MDYVAAAVSLPNWDPLPSPIAELGARLPWQEGEGGGWELVPVSTEDAQGLC